MTVIAFLFGGQGADPPVVGAELAERSRPARELLDIGSRAAGMDLPRLLRQGSPKLHRTEVQQPAVVSVGLAAAGYLAEAGIRPAYVAGHSLGELAAWAASGAVAPADAISAAAFRGKLMRRLAEAYPGGMLALASGSEAGLDAALRHGREHGELVMAAHNGPGEWSLSGEETAIRAVARKFLSRRIPVQGAWHSPGMQDGVDEFTSLLSGLPRHRPWARFLSNRTGALVADEMDIPGLIAGQLAHPVLWAKTLETLAAAGVSDFVAIGSEKFLRSLVYKNLGRGPRLHGAETLAALDQAIRHLRP